MGSRPAIEAFMRAAPKAGIECLLASSTARFTFANGETSKVSQCCRVKFPTVPPTWTDFDIVEQGAVPILMSLGQMKNLGFDLETTPETVYLTCKAFGCYRQPLHVAYTGHLVLDLAKLKYSPSDSRHRAAGQHSVFLPESQTVTVQPAGAFTGNTPVLVAPVLRPDLPGVVTQTVSCLHPETAKASQNSSRRLVQNQLGTETERPQGPHPVLHHPHLFRVRCRRRAHL